jgi:hypothetical protein
LYELSRVRLHTVGPKGARYQDVTLDLRGVGPSARSVDLNSLFSDDFSQGLNRSHRPSPATVLFLENGGGKTVLVKLIFSVMLPGRRQVVGTSSTRVLDKFVLAADVAHVALEWQNTKTGDLLVTGKASEWRGHVVSADPSRLTERWYSFRPTPSLSLSTLPFTESGRIVSLSGFRDRLEEEQSANPALQFGWEKNHGDWTDHLEKLRLDPELFLYQRKMNAGEGEAADAFTFKTDEAFVDWLLTAIIPDEEPQSLGDVVAGYADKLASRGELLAERGFVEGALDRLKPLAHAARERAAAIDIHNDARVDAERLIVMLTAREAQESERYRLLEDQFSDIETRERSVDRKVGRLNAIVLELSRLVAQMRLEAARDECGRLEGERDNARNLLAAWLATNRLVRYNSACKEAEEIRTLVHQQESEAEPVLHLRDLAAKRFARGLLAAAAAADAAAKSADGRGSTSNAGIQQADDDERAAIRDGEAANAKIGRATEDIGAAQIAIQAAVAAKLLAAHEDVADAAETAAEAAADAETEESDALTRSGELAADREEATEVLDGLRSDLQNKSRIAEKLDEQLTAARQIADELSGTSRLVDLFGSEEIELDSDSATLHDLLTEAIEATVQESDRHRRDAAVDQRVLDALGTGGLLPPSDEVSAALEVLTDKHMTCWSGWEYLASVRADERDQVLARYPQLVDGIVLNSGDDLKHARDELTVARLLPHTVIAVGTTAAITVVDAPAPAGIGFIVPPSPAMYDAEQAEVERQEIQRRQDARSRRLTELGTVVEVDRGLRAQLEVWQRDYPPGRLGKLATDQQQAATEQRRAQERVRGQSDALAELARQERELKQRLPHLHRQAKEVKEKAAKLTALAAEHAKIPGWQETMRTAKAEVVRADQEAARARTRAAEFRRQELEAYREADGHRRTASECRAELSDVSGGGSVDETMPVPREPLESLRSAFKAAVTAYEKVEVDADLRAELGRVDKAESDARSDIEKIDQAVRLRASELLYTPDGTDVGARDMATARTQRLADALDALVRTAAEETGRLEQLYNSYQKQDRSLEPYGPPRDIPHGEELISQATSDWDTARKDLDDIQAHKETLSQRLTVTDRVMNDFGAVRESLAAIVAPEAGFPAEPFAGTVDAARMRRDTVRETLSAAKLLLEGATDQVRRAADALAQHATDERFGKVAAPVRRQMIATERERLPDFADDWEAALRPRFRVLSDELDQIERHRVAIIMRGTGEPAP